MRNLFLSKKYKNFTLVAVFSSFIIRIFQKKTFIPLLNIKLKHIDHFANVLIINIF